MRLARTVTILASDADLGSRSQGSRRGVASEASLLQTRSQDAAKGFFIIRGLLFGKPELEREPVLERRVDVPAFDQGRARQRQAVQRGNTEQKSDPVAFAADDALHRKFERRLPWHLDSILQFLAGSLDRVLDCGIRPLRMRLRIIRRQKLGSKRL